MRSTNGRGAGRCRRRGSGWRLGPGLRPRNRARRPLAPLARGSPPPGRTARPCGCTTRGSAAVRRPPRARPRDAHKRLALATGSTPNSAAAATRKLVGKSEGGGQRNAAAADLWCGPPLSGWGPMRRATAGVGSVSGKGGRRRGGWRNESRGTLGESICGPLPLRAGNGAIEDETGGSMRRRTSWLAAPPPGGSAARGSMRRQKVTAAPPGEVAQPRAAEVRRCRVHCGRLRV